MDICRLPSLDRILPEFTSRNRVVKRPLQDVLSPKRCRKDSKSFFAAIDIRAFFVDCCVVFVSLLPAMLKFLGKNRQAERNVESYSGLIVKTRLCQMAFPKFGNYFSNLWRRFGFCCSFAA